MRLTKFLISLAIVCGNSMNEAQFSLLSWNILGPLTQDVEYFGFKYGDYDRLIDVLDVIQKSSADIICLQEVDKRSFLFFNSHLLATYEAVCYHAKGTHGGVVVYVRRSMFDINGSWGYTLDSGHERSPGAIAGGIIVHKPTGNKFYVASVHISRSHDRRSMVFGHEQWKAAHHFIKNEIQPIMILAGDYNTLYEEVVHDTVPLLHTLFQQPIEMYRHRSCTANSPFGAFTSVDHVLFSHLHLVSLESQVGNKQYIFDPIVSTVTVMMLQAFPPIQKVFPSDHAPVYTVFDFHIPVVVEKLTVQRPGHLKGKKTST